MVRVFKVEEVDSGTDVAYLTLDTHIDDGVDDGLTAEFDALNAHESTDVPDLDCSDVVRADNHWGVFDDLDSCDHRHMPNQLPLPRRIIVIRIDLKQLNSVFKATSHQYLVGC